MRRVLTAIAIIVAPIAVRAASETSPEERTRILIEAVEKACRPPGTSNECRNARIDLDVWSTNQPRRFKSTLRAELRAGGRHEPQETRRVRGAARAKIRSALSLRSLR